MLNELKNAGGVLEISVKRNHSGTNTCIRSSGYILAQTQVSEWLANWG